MKKLLLSTVALLAMSAAMAQKNAPGLYIRAGAGYSFALAGQTLDNNGLPYDGNIVYQPNGNPPAVDSTYDVKKISFASGVQVLASVGYMFSKYIGLEVQMSAIPSSIKYESYFYNAFNPSGANRVTEHDVRQMSVPFFIAPSLVFNTGDDKQFSCYARGGVVLPVVSKITEDQTYETVLSGTQENVKQGTKMKFGIGFSGSMGVKYNATPVLSVWAEFNMQAMSLYADQTTVTDHTVNGDPAPPGNVPVVGTVIKYRANGTFGPTSMPAYSIPFSNMGASIGIMVKLKAPKPVEEEPHRKK